ncbi:MAG: PQQ-binding-like beta-propeller repeat protein [Pirellulaceae bacterium]|jgi:hypothetical protein|nr:PQQ-binding-like beta-propeller repeat protein [Pirellulaceae bacterium]MDP7015897.1 PQQ-binding-like beta-propeller repeat protein [Pirellulaceae bacterium]
MKQTHLPLLIVLLTATCAHAENWPGWRGPRGDGTSAEKNPPLRWDGATGENIIWKAPTKDVGHASPVVWNDRVLLVGCNLATKERTLSCLDRKTGETLWRKVVLKSVLESKHTLNSFASSTPATDGNLIYVSFLQARNDKLVEAPNVGAKRLITPGRMVVAAYDFDGNQRWITKPGDFVSAHGYCSCPVVFNELVIINGDHDGESYVVALNKATGEQVWKTGREYKTRSYVTPLIRRINNRHEMVFSGSRCIISLDPRTGKRHWRIEGPTEQFVASMVYDGDKFYMAAGYPTYHVMGIRPGGAGDVTESHVQWHVQNVRCYVPSPVIVDRFLLVADDRGTANCFDTKTGSRHWQTRMGKHYSSSLLTAAGMVYFVADDGITKILKPGVEVNVLHENSLGEYTFASPALSDGQLFIRGEKNLYCIGDRTAE